MATPRQMDPAQHWIMRFLPLQTLKNAQDLAQRFRKVEGIRVYVHERQTMVVAATLVIMFIPAPGATALWLSKKFGLDMGPFPPVRWVLVALVVSLPLALLAAAWLIAALTVILLGILMPVVYAKLASRHADELAQRA